MSDAVPAVPRRDGHVRLLPLHVANKIAAGEVVERPASVLKELLENALDAGATRIDVTVVAGGRNLVAVRDDGCGMGREDALLSLERQATSKIRDVDDIERIDTLGFRGEAIPSIAAVSRFTLVTRRAADEAGTRLVVNSGTLAEVSDCGAPAGTLVEVRDLFCNVPARRKFLRAYQTEETHIRATFVTHALAHPEVGFSLTVDGRETYRLASGATCEERIHDFFGADYSACLVPLAAETEGVKVHGYAERPGSAGTVRRDQYVFVNGRPATAPAIAYALREACPRAQGEARPGMVIFIELPPTDVDVNVHPAKREVRFRKPALVREALMTALATALSPVGAGGDAAVAGRPPYQATPFVAPFTSSPSPSPYSWSSTSASPSTIPDPGPALPVQEPLPTPPWQDPPTLVVAPTADAAQTRIALPTEGTLTNADGPWRWFKFLAVTDSGYLLIETDSGVVTVNPAAARARIAYEQLLDAAVPLSQPLLIPETVQLPPPDSARIRSFLDVLTRYGFAVEEFGRDTWKIDAVPQLADGLVLADLLATIASDIAEAGAKRGGARWREETIARGVAKSYAGMNTALTPDGAVKLVNELAACRMPYISPQGRPTMIYTSTTELKRKFSK